MRCPAATCLVRTAHVAAGNTSSVLNLRRLESAEPCRSNNTVYTCGADSGYDRRSVFDLPSKSPSEPHTHSRPTGLSSKGAFSTGRRGHFKPPLPQLQQNRFWCTKNHSGTPDLFLAQKCWKISHQIDFNHNKTVSVAPKIVLLHQICFWRKMWKHFARDRFQLQQNRFWCN